MRDSKWHWPTITRTSDTTATISWEPYTNPETVPDRLKIQMALETARGTPFRLDCKGDWADDGIVNTTITDLLNSPNIISVTGLTPGTLYAVHEEFRDLCVNRTVYYLSSCQMSPDPLDLASVGDTDTLTPQISYESGQTIGIQYESDSTDVATVTNRSYQFTPGLTHDTTVTGVSVDQTQVWDTVYFLDNESWKEVCRDSAVVNVGVVPSVGTLRARAVTVDTADTSCAAIRSIPTTDADIDGTTHQFTPSSASQPAAQTQTGADYVTFSSVPVGSYTLDLVPPSADWAFARSCWTNETTGTSGEGLSQTLAADQSLRWDVGYTRGTPWVQTEGGEVFVGGTRG